MFTSSILHGKSPRAKYSFDIIFHRLRYKFSCTVVRLRFLPHQVFHTTQVYSSDNRQQSKYFSCGFFWFIKYACVICTTVFVFRVKSMCVCVCKKESKTEKVWVCVSVCSEGWVDLLQWGCVHALFPSLHGFNLCIGAQYEVSVRLCCVCVCVFSTVVFLLSAVDVAVLPCLCLCLWCVNVVYCGCFLCAFSHVMCCACVLSGFICLNSLG